MARIVNAADLPSKRFEGDLYGDVPISFFVSATQPGRGPKLHTHPYAEVIVLHAGRLTFVVDEQTIGAAAGQIVIVPPGVPHKFTNTGEEIAHHVDIHTRGWIETTWLEE